jgi:protein AaeX
MSFFEIDILGVYVAPIVPMMLVAWVILMALRRVADHFGLMRHVWRPSLFVLVVYVILLGAMVLLAAARGRTWLI